MKCLVALFGLVVAAVLLACSSPAVSPTPAPKSAAGQASTGVSSGLAGNWERIVAEAKKEGTVNVYSIWKAEARVGVTEAFKKKYGINVEFSPFSRGEEILTKVQMEQRAGLFLVDVFGGGAGGTLSTTLRPAGVLAPLKPLLVLPEVLDTKAWRGGELPFIDKEGMSLALVDIVVRTVGYNPDLVREGEIKSYRDLLKPQYKGRITSVDPTMTGMANASIAHLGMNLWSEAETIDWIRRFFKTQDVLVQRDLRLHVESVARGKYPIGFGPNAEITAQFVGQGASLKLAMVEEDNRITSSSGGIGVPARLAHPNAAILFVNWLLTKEGQSVYATSYGSASTRIDASKEGIDPLFIPDPAKKYYTDSDEFVDARAKWLKLAKQVLEEAK